MTMPHCFYGASLQLPFSCIWQENQQKLLRQTVGSAYVGCYESVLWLGPLAHGFKLTLHTCRSSTRHPGSIYLSSSPTLQKEKRLGL